MNMFYWIIYSRMTKGLGL